MSAYEDMGVEGVNAQPTRTVTSKRNRKGETAVVGDTFSRQMTVTEDLLVSPGSSPPGRQGQGPPGGLWEGKVTGTEEAHGSEASPAHQVTSQL